MRGAVLPALALMSAGGLVWHGVRGDVKPELEPLREQVKAPAFPQVVEGSKLEPPELSNTDPFFLYDRFLPLTVFIPAGYGDIPPGEIVLGAEGNGYWHMEGARRGRFGVHVWQLPRPDGGYVTQLSLFYDFTGAEFSGQWPLEARGRVWPGRLPSPTKPTYFPLAKEPWIVFQR